jgi:hypothetical protein
MSCTIPSSFAMRGMYIGNKPSQRFFLLHSILENILRGFDNQVIMGTTLKDQ